MATKKRKASTSNSNALPTSPQVSTSRPKRNTNHAHSPPIPSRTQLTPRRPINYKEDTSSSDFSDYGSKFDSDSDYEDQNYEPAPEKSGKKEKIISDLSSNKSGAPKTEIKTTTTQHKIETARSKRDGSEKRVGKVAKPASTTPTPSTLDEI